MILFLILFKVAWVLVQAMAWIFFAVGFAALWLVWMLFSLPFRFLGLARG
jgi:hypothetical protein